MSSSKEILLFRRVLLNPITSLQFQHFVCLKGGFLENDVLFWQEVQRYKVRAAGPAAGESDAARTYAGVHVQLPLRNNREK